MNFLCFLAVLTGVAILVASSFIAAEDKYIEILEYTDELCTGGSLVNTRAPVGKCYSGHYASGSGILNCSNLPPAQPRFQCLRMNMFSDAACSSQLSVHDRVCGTCDGDRTGKHANLLCSSADTSAVVYRHDCDYERSTKRCANCTKTIKIPFKTCTLFDESTSKYVRVDEVTDCKNGVINIKDFSGTTVCSNTAPMSEFYVENEGCAGGVKYVCKN